MVKAPQDLLALTSTEGSEQLRKLPHWGAVSATKLLSEIEKAKEGVPLHRGGVESEASQSSRSPLQEVDRAENALLAAYLGPKGDQVCPAKCHSHCCSQPWLRGL